MRKITFDAKGSSFFNTLKEKVDRYFSEQQLDPTGSRKLYVKSSILVVSALSLYCLLVFFNLPIVLAIGACALLGFNLAAIGFNIMHEGGHQSFSRYPWLNSLSAYFLNVLGGNTYYWKIKHNINHHTYTNIEGADSDIDVKPFMRLHGEQPRLAMHRFQHIYWVVLYGLSYIAWVFKDDFVKYFSGRVSPHMPKKQLSVKEHIIFWATKIFYVSVYLVIPIMMVGIMKALIGFLIVTVVCGLFIAIVFQLAHTVGGTEFVMPDNSAGNVGEEWAVHQVNVTSNFATRSKLLTWLLGGLNFQIEHHLFPRVSHIHYPQISKLVRETCREYNIIYNEYPTMIRAFFAHVLFLRKMGTA